MNEKELIEIVNNMDLNNKINLEDIPELDLYMDQVIQLFESKMSSTKRTEEDKVLTKTMINNYAKAKLLMSIKNKKYSKEHLVLMSLIYDLKGGLSIGDIKLTLDKIVQKFESGEGYDLRNLYTTYLQIYNGDVEEFEKSVINRSKVISNKLKSAGLEGEFEEKFLLICSFTSMSNMYRRMSEKLIDEYFAKGDE